MIPPVGWLVGLSVIISKQGGKSHFHKPIEALYHNFKSLVVAEQFYLVSANTTKKIQRENSFITLNLPFISYHRRKFLDLSNDFLSIIGLHICMKKP